MSEYAAGTAKLEKENHSCTSVGCQTCWLPQSVGACRWIDGWMDGGSEIEESRQERMEKNKLKSERMNAFEGKG